MKNSSKHETLRGWFQLIRLPHLFTVPGDPLIGFLIAGRSRQSARDRNERKSSSCFSRVSRS